MNHLIYASAALLLVAAAVGALAVAAGAYLIIHDSVTAIQQAIGG